MDGVIIVDKPAGWTSHDVVAKMRGIAQTRKVGHLGTLDPMATGVLPVVIGKATRLSQFYTRSDKIYEGVVRFGWSTHSYDRSRSIRPNWKASWISSAASSTRFRLRYRPRKWTGGGHTTWRASQNR